MADETEKPKPRRRRKPSPASAPPRRQDETHQQDEPTRGGSDADEATPTPSEPEAPVTPTEDEAAAPVAQEEKQEKPKPKPRRKAPAKPAPSRRRAAREPAAPRPPVLVRAQAKYVRSSARKARLVCDHIRGKSVEEARAILALAPRAVARDWSKLLESAVANAEHNHELVGEDLYIKAVRADEGPTIKRFRPRALGRATRIRKRTSHLTILLTPKLREAGGRKSSSKRGAGGPAED
jgi:ribosomal protein L22